MLATQEASVRRLSSWQVWLGGTVTVLLLGGLWVASFFCLSSDTRALRRSALASLHADCDQKIALRVGGTTVTLTRAVSSLFNLDPEVRAALASLDSAEISVHQRREDHSPANHAAILAAADDTMRARGWTRMVGVADDHKVMAIYVAEKSLSAQWVNCCLMMLDEKTLVIASARGNLEPLAAIAQSRFDLAKAKLAPVKLAKR